MNIRKSFIVSALAFVGLVGAPAPASADITFFLGLTPRPETRQLRGVSAGISMLIVGFEFDYAVTREDTAKELPGMWTGMFNILVQTPTNTSVYVTAGGGIYRESLAGAREQGFGTNVGGGIKFGILGPLKVRIDYRVFDLRGNPRNNRPQRLYVGINWPF